MDLIFTTSYDCAQLSADEYKFLQVTEVPLVAYMHKNHPLARKEVLEIEDLRAEHLMMVDQTSSSGYFNFIRQLFLVRNIHPLIAQYAHDGGEHIGSILFDKGILLASRLFWRIPGKTRSLAFPLKMLRFMLRLSGKREIHPVLLKFLQSIIDSSD